MSQYLEKLIGLLRKDHPDLSRWTIICASDMAVDPLQNLIHRELGGILPKIEGFRSYVAGRIGRHMKLKPVPPDEVLFYFIQFIAQRFPDEAYPARRAAGLLPLIAKLSEYNIGRDTIWGSERFTEVEWERIEEYLDMAQGFREWLSRLDFFMTELEMSRFDEMVPSEKEIFVGLPEITPVTERFYRKIREEKLWLDRPLYGLGLEGKEKLPFDSAKNLVLSFGGEVETAQSACIEMVSLNGLHAIVDLVTVEVSNFLKERSEEDQMMIYLLDESLTTMLWNRSLRLYGNAVNLAVWLPFSTTAAASRLLKEIDNAGKADRIPDFKSFATACAIELSKNRDQYVREECEALETAISVSTFLDDWKERLGCHLTDAVKMLIESKKFRLTGSRSAPVQVVGFGHVSGEKFSRGLMLPLDSGIMPSQPFEGPFINPVHVPWMRKSVFEYEDLIFRQILSKGSRIKIVAVEDPIRERTPSFYMTFLAQEFVIPITQTEFRASLPVAKDKKRPVVSIDNALRDRLRKFMYSFSSLSKILACPFLFYQQYILRISPPSFMNGDEKINMRIGIFVHQFLQKLSTDRKDLLDDWEKLFDELWESDENAQTRDIDGINIYRLDAKIHLKEIYQDELDSGERIIFADNAISCEEMFNGVIEGGYQITGRSDRLAQISGRTDVMDFKYSKKKSDFNISSKTNVVEQLEDKGILHPAAQLMIYHHFIRKVDRVFFYFLKESSQDRILALPEDWIAVTDDLMRAIRDRLDKIISGSELKPDYDSPECEYCLFQALCGRDVYYKASRRDA
ncbi:MAG: PD-(D/E)XK nuclease family protein [Smithella sp.]|jgi:CRISPR/Cas system-associated exonuclease Cas4 (RecB family)